DLDALVAQACNAAGPRALDHRRAFELQAENSEERDRRLEVLDDDAHVVHPLHCHPTTLRTTGPPTPRLLPCSGTFKALRADVSADTPMTWLGASSSSVSARSHLLVT